MLKIEQNPVKFNRRKYRKLTDLKNAINKYVEKNKVSIGEVQRMITLQNETCVYLEYDAKEEPPRVFTEHRITHKYRCNKCKKDVFAKCHKCKKRIFQSDKIHCYEGIQHFHLNRCFLSYITYEKKQMFSEVLG